MLGSNGHIDRRAYTLCVMERLQDNLRRRDVFVPASERWSDPRVKLIHGAQWEAMPQVCRALGRQERPEPELALAEQLEPPTNGRRATSAPMPRYAWSHLRVEIVSF